MQGDQPQNFDKKLKQKMLQMKDQRGIGEIQRVEARMKTKMMKVKI